MATYNYLSAYYGSGRTVGLNCVLLGDSYLDNTGAYFYASYTNSLYIPN